jgi:outer membrane biosynthesis protein TonB
MITHLLFKGLNSFNIGSIMFRKILAIIIAVLVFALVFLAVKFTKVEVPNFNRNLIMLAVVDISAFGLVIWKLSPPCENKPDEQPAEKPDEQPAEKPDEQPDEKLKENKQKEELVDENQKESSKPDTKEPETEEQDEMEEEK